MTENELYREIRKTALMGARMARDMMKKYDDEEFGLELKRLENGYRQLMYEAGEGAEKSGKGNARSLSALTSSEFGSLGAKTGEDRARALSERLIELELEHREIYRRFLS